MAKEPKDDPSVEGEYEEPERVERSREAVKYVGRDAVLARLWEALESVGVTEANVGKHQLFRLFDLLADAYDAGAEGNPFHGFTEWTATTDPFPEWTANDNPGRQSARQHKKRPER